LRTRELCVLTLLGALGTARVATAQTDPGVPSIPADRYERQSALDVLHYEVSIELPAEGSEVAGRTAVLFQAVAEDLSGIALDLGAADFIAKPYSRAVLQARVRNLLELKRRADAELLHAHRKPSPHPATHFQTTGTPLHE